MTHPTHLLRFIRSAALIAVLTGASQSAFAADIGKVMLAAGDTVAIRDGQTVKLAHGSAIADRDVLRTGQSSNLQIRFIDESIISMKESSELRINDFKYAGKADGTERAFYTLVKGGLRAVTGAIGHTNRKNYSMSTAVATLGVRGTDYSITLCQRDCRNADGSLAKDGFYGRVLGQSHGSNRVDVTNGRNSKVFGISENFYVADTMSTVQRLLTPPEFVSNRLEGRKQGGNQKAPGGSGVERAATGGGVESDSRTNAKPEAVPVIQYVATQELGAQGKPVVVLPAVNGWLVVYPQSAAIEQAIFDNGDSAIFSNSNQLTSFGSGKFPSGSIKGGTIVDAGSLTLSNGQLITWGRWTGSTAVVTSNGATLTGVPVLFGTVSAARDLPTSPQFDGVATYRYTGGPKPVDFGGNTGNVSSTALTINFTTRTAEFAMVADFANVGTSGSAQFIVNGKGGLQSAAHSGDIGGKLTGTCTGGGCANAAVSGEFGLGTTGSKNYEIAVVGGSIAGTKAGGVAFLNLYQVTNVITVKSLLNGQVTWADPTIAPANTITLQSTTGTFDVANDLTAFSSATLCTTTSCTLSGTVGTGTLVDTGSTTLLDGSTVSWGRWSGGQITDQKSGTLTTYTPPTGVAFVFGSDSTTLPT
ncbi:MAG TPA: FecR domain-containing protein, partial [Terriglobia bacterium]|nr:FecR domain-containing protein [Terriglobia bacterium]